MDFASQLAKVTEQANYLRSLDVIDINFESGHSLEVFVASNSDQRRRGLSSLDYIPTQGMLFYYSVATYKPFTMRNMVFDLDIGWFDSDGKMLDAQYQSAGVDKPVVTQHKFSYVLETPTGMLPLSNMVLSNG